MTSSTPAEYQKPLAGVRVFDLSRVLAGPVCTQLLADLGADVVKIERPGVGDDTRQWGPPFVEPGQSGYYLSCNRGKRSLALDLNHPDARPVVDDLVRTSDVLVENFLPENLTKFGLEPERLQKLRPDLVIASISAFGRGNAWSALPGYDLMIQAGFGLMSITGDVDGVPMKVGVAITDIITGLYTAVSILAGLHARGQGRSAAHFDLALADCTLASLVNVAQGCLLTGQPPLRYANAHPQIVPYEAFATSDGFIALAIGADRQWQRFCQATGEPAWAADPRFATNPARVQHRQELIPLVASVMLARTTAQWQELLTRIDIPHSPVLRVDEALVAPQAAARGMVAEVEDAHGHRYRMLGSPVHIDGHSQTSTRPPPYLGQHSDEVLADWLGYDAPRIAALRKTRVID